MNLMLNLASSIAAEKKPHRSASPEPQVLSALFFFSVGFFVIGLLAVLIFSLCRPVTISR